VTAPGRPALTSREVAALWRVGRRTVSGWAAAGLVESFRTPAGRHRYPAAQFDGLPALLLAAEVAGLLRVHPATVLRWVREGKAQVLRTPGGHVRLPAAQFDGLPAVPGQGGAA
jgi:excisionase family DNA binding protein